ncbi:DUF6585 family protein [Catellatospora sichuanensis]|uniref:DUF6585 family protein n=1 Tax=Catellatospora sichuanensis TaxID=1969805 RepID=UPI001182DFC2|nr:DUF6585 family protein [Catellatospora sichuanensis]
MTLLVESALGLAPDVTVAASMRNLGEHRESYPAVTPKPLMLASGMFAVLFGVLAGGATWGAIVGDPAVWIAATILWAITAPCLLGFLWVLLRSPAVSRRARQFRVHVFEHGWVWARRSGTEAYRWDEVQALFANLAVFTAEVGSRTPYGIRIAAVDGRRMEIWQVHVDMARFGRLLTARVAQAQLPKAMAYFDKGNPVTFGDLTVTDDGVAFQGILTPWSEIGGVEIDHTDQSYLSLVDRQYRRRGARVNFGLMANGYTFVLMVEAILTKLRGVGQ